MVEFLVSAALIFFLRVVDITLYTLRLMMMMRGLKIRAMVFAFFQALVFVVAMREVFSDLGNWAKILGYSAGFATGLVVGMVVENRLAVGFTHLDIISGARGAELVEHLRESGFAVTEIAAHGKEGTVSLLNCNVRRKDVAQLASLVIQTDPQAFITAKDVRSVQRGFWQHALGGEKRN